MQSTVDLVPGAYYGRLAGEQFRAGNYGQAVVYGAASLVDAAIGVATLGESSLAEGTARGGAKLGAEATTEAAGGMYVLVDPETGKVMRTGRTNSFVRRRGEHGRDADLKDFDFKPIYPTDNYAEQRGLEQHLYEKDNAPFDNNNAISPRHKKIQEYLEAAKKYLERYPDQ